ncbi:hypothetical protein [Streptomyces sp. NPDC048357]|uniref:hypothetical protein n=1 Tax=Streptomyces sp. NPDC048357 TaxID=3154719 RepID=UPI003412197F
MRPPFRFPEVLITFQRAWQQTYAGLAQAGPCTTVLRRRLTTLSGTLCTHPYWAAPTTWRASSVELRRAARTHTSAPAAGEATA